MAPLLWHISVRQVLGGGGCISHFNLPAISVSLHRMTGTDVDGLRGTFFSTGGGGSRGGAGSFFTATDLGCDSL